MKKILLTVSASALLGVAAIASAPASAAPLAASHYAAHRPSHVQQVHYVRRPHFRRHFWAPWRHPHRHCYPIRHGFVCYY
jgi:hypothetical protein